MPSAQIIDIPKPFFGGPIATLRNDITRGYVTDFLQSQDEILLQKGGLGWDALKIYEALKTDAHLMACMRQFVAAVTANEIEVMPGARKGSNPMRVDKLAAGQLQETIAALDFDRIAQETLWAKYYGYGVQELLLEREGATVQITDIKVRHRRRFRFDFDLNTRLIELDNVAPGELMDPSVVWTTCYGPDNSDEPYGLGDAQAIYWPVVFKKGGMRAWLQFLEDYGRPKAIIKHRAGLSDEEQKEVDEVAAAIDERKSVAMTDDLEAEWFEANFGATADYASVNEICNADISKVILGQTETTESSSSSGYAQAKVHEGVKGSIVKAGADLVMSSFNRQVAARLAYWNYEGAIAPKAWYKLELDEDLTDRADRDAKLFDLGIRLKSDRVAQVYGDDYQVAEADTVLLNGAQITSVTQLVKDAASGAIPVESAKQLMIATLNIPEAIATAILDPIDQQLKEQAAAEEAKAKETANLFPAEEEQPVVEEEAVEEEAEFSEFYQLTGVYFAAPQSKAPVKKNCTKGVYCIGKTGRGSCVKAGSRCSRTAVQGSQDYTAAIGPQPAKGKDGKTVSTRIDAEFQETFDAAIAEQRAKEISYWESRKKIAQDEDDGFGSRENVIAYAEAQIEYAKNREYRDPASLSDAEKTELKAALKAIAKDTSAANIAKEEAALDARADAIKKRYEEDFTAEEREIIAGSSRLRSLKEKVRLLDTKVDLALPWEDAGALAKELKASKKELKALERSEATKFGEILKAKAAAYKEYEDKKFELIDDRESLEERKAEIVARPSPLAKLISKPIDPKPSDMPDLGGDRASDLRKEAVRIYGEETIKNVETNLKRIVSESDLMVRLREDSLGLIIDGGRFKSSTELGNKPTGYDRRRLEVEDLAFTGGKGYVPDATTTAIYGYLANKNNPYGPAHKGVTGYGNMAVVLRKESVSDRASFSGEDSFRGLAVSKLNDPNVSSVMPLVEEGVKTGAARGIDPYRESKKLIEGLAKADGDIDDAIRKTRSPYFEYQVHGGVKSDEIAEIHYYNGEKPKASIAKWAKANGVAIVKHPRSEEEDFFDWPED